MTRFRKDASGASPASPALSIIRRLIAGHKLALAVGLLALFSVDLLQLYVPRIIKFAVDDLTASRASAHSLLLQAGMVLALAAGMAVLRIVWRPLLFGFSRRVERGLRLSLFGHLQGLHLGYFKNNPPGELMAKATNDLNNIRMAAGIGLVAAVDGFALGICAIGFMVYISPLLTVLAILPMPLIVILTRVLSRRLHGLFLRNQEAFAAMTELVREVLSGIHLVKVYALLKREESRLGRSGREYLDINLDLARHLGLFFPLMVFFTNLSLAVILGIGGPLAVLGRITAGDFVAFAAYLNMLTWPMMALGWVVSVMQRAWGSLERVDAVLRAQPQIQDPPHPRQLHTEGGLGIQVRGLTFTYPGEERPALHQVSLDIAPGQAVALAGRIGSGKSTLLALLGRLYDPPPGAIRLGDVDILDVTQAGLRSQVVQVPQDAFLFSATVRTNLALGRPEADDEDLWAALEAAALNDEVRDLPKGLDTMLGERALTLSGGQRQRLTLARALLLDPEVLVLDDPLSAVDTETERRILKNLARLRKGRTTLVVSHRLASVDFAEQIYVFDQGRVVEKGAHKELLAAGGLYQTLFAEQA
ncbi:MAG: ABC transporter ATP-binding protein, partial [Desulfarculaceae bacterium]